MLKVISAVFCALLIWAGNSNAAVVLQVEQGKLTGATGFVVDGVTYDVSFMDGTCDALFGGCSSFIFNNDRNKTIRAAQALLDSVFLNGPNGSFDDNQTLTRGCSDPWVCQVVTPYRLGINNSVQTIAALNYGLAASQQFGAYGNDVVSTGVDIVFTRDWSLGGTGGYNTQYTYAVWSLAQQGPQAVPEPAGGPLVALGLLGLLATLKRRR